MESELPEIMTVRPLGWPEMSAGYLGLVSYMARDIEVLRAFQEATGHDLSTLDGSPIDEAISESSGHKKALVTEFLDWVTVNHWGEA